MKLSEDQLKYIKFLGVDAKNATKEFWKEPSKSAALRQESFIFAQLEVPCKCCEHVDNKLKMLHWQRPYIMIHMWCCVCSYEKVVLYKYGWRLKLIDWIKDRIWR